MFTITDLKKHYVVYLTYYLGDKLPPWYIGSSNEQRVMEGYNGSVKSKKYKDLYIKEQKENKHLFKTRILSYHKTREEALAEELRIQKLHNVAKNKNYFNESYAVKNGTNVCKQETKEKIGLKNSKLFDIYNENNILVLENITINSIIYKEFNFPPTFRLTAARNKVYKISPSTKEEHKKYQGWYLKYSKGEK